MSASSKHRSALKKASAKRAYHIDYRLEGTVEVQATSAEEAQDWFDSELANGTPRWFDANGEVSNDKPYTDESLAADVDVLNKERAQKGGP